jgi:hypothetical protein
MQLLFIMISELWVIPIILKPIHILILMFWDNLTREIPTTVLYLIYEVLPGTGC